MKAIQVLVLMVLVLGQSVLSHAGGAKNYLSLSGVLSVPNDMTFDNELSEATLALDSGSVGFSGAIGREIASGSFASLRVEIEMNYQQIDELNMTSKRDYEWKGGEINIASPMLNIYYDQKLFRGKLSPYVGVGAGASFISHSMKQMDATVFAGQLKAGVKYALTKNIGLIAGYKYFRTGEFSYNTVVLPVNTAEMGINRLSHSDKLEGWDGDYRLIGKTHIETHNFEMGLSFAF